MNSLRINTGIVTIEVNDNGDTISFTPDVLFVERFQSLYDQIDEKAADFKEREEALNANTELDANGIPVNSRERTAIIKEVCIYCQGMIDDLFGAGTCHKALGNAMHPDFYIELLEGLTPFIKFERKQLKANYAKK